MHVHTDGFEKEKSEIGAANLTLVLPLYPFPFVFYWLYRVSSQSIFTDTFNTYNERRNGCMIGINWLYFPNCLLYTKL